MNILYFHQHFSTPNGSTGNRSYEMATCLVNRGHKVIMVCGAYKAGETGLTCDFKRGMRRGQVNGIDIIEFNLPYANQDNFIKRTWVFLRYVVRSTLLIFTEKYDVVFATTTPLTAGIPGIVGRWLLGKSFVFEVRDLWPELPKAMGAIKNPIILYMLKLLEYTTYYSAHRLIGLSPGIVEGIHKCGISRNKIKLIPNGCDLGIFDTSEFWRPEGASENDFMAIYAGTHGMANGLESIIEAASILQKQQIKHIKIVLIGQGMLKPKLQARAQKENLQNVIFLEPVSKLKLAGLMRSANLGLQILANVPAFYYGTSPNKFFDYIASGLPVLTNYPGWIAELITENKCGFAVPPQDSEAFANTLIEAAANPQLLTKMGEAALLLAENQFNRALLANEFVDWIEFNEYSSVMKSMQ